VPEPFLLDPKNADFAAGRSRALSYSGSRLLDVSGLCFCAFGSIFIAFVGREWRHYFELRARGKDVVGRVLELEKRYDEGTSYMMRFAYQPPGQPELSGRVQITQDAYDVHRKGGPVAVRYSPARPEIARPSGAAWHGGWGLLAMTGFLLLWHALPAALMIFGLIEARRRALMAREGVVLPATAVKVSCEYDSDNDLQLKIRFRFQPPDSHAVEDEASALRNDLKKGQVPREGAALRVAYARGKHLLL
jgi:hypothetical protein